jgi:hypothetical protein
LDEALEVGVGNGANAIGDPVRRLAGACVVALDLSDDDLIVLAQLVSGPILFRRNFDVVGELVGREDAAVGEGEEVHDTTFHRRGKRFRRQARAWISMAIGSPPGVAL